MSAPISIASDQSTDLVVLSRPELKALEIPERIPLLGDWLTERHPSLIYAQTGRGKSLFAMSIAIAVAGGGTVFGWAAPEPRRVLYVDAEMDIADIKSRDGLLVPAVEGVDGEALDANLLLLSRHHQGRGAVFPDLVDPQGQQALLEHVKHIRPALVILDNLSTMAEIRDENDAAAFGPVLETLWKLRQLGCAVILIHHTGKQEGKFRGSSKLAATFESVLQLAPHGDLLRDQAAFTIRVDKFRGGQAPESLEVHLEVDDAGDGNWAYQAALDRRLLVLVDEALSQNHASQNELAEALGLSKGEVSKRKHRAIANGLITKEEWSDSLRAARELRDDSDEFQDFDMEGSHV